MTTPEYLDDPFYHALKSMSQRMDYLPGKYLLQSYALPTSVGWESTLQRAVVAARTRPDREKLYTNLATSFQQHTLVGEKAVLYYGFAGLSEETKQIHKRAVYKKVGDHIPLSQFSAVFPFAVHDQETLRSLENTPPTLTICYPEANGVFFLFSSVRSFNERVPLDRTLFDDDDQAKLADYSELIGVRSIRRQCYDYIIYDTDRELVEVRIDCPDGMPSVQKQTALQKLQAAFKDLNIFPDGWSPFGTTPHNFHSLMERLYKTSGEGTVFQLGFTASTEKTSSNNGASLLRRKNVDLRRDEFHVGGKNNVKDLSVYTIGVEWKSDFGINNPTLIVPGSVRMLYSSPVIFPELYIRNCMTIAQYALITAKIDKYFE
ncbi:hypothetical protein QPK32_04100 [Massilia sp. YIM B02763]|uniref:hypothetical protein n=1 Tax=Massilia sp. YIM B02763 TaxID=3050130 RepID=UPI0025B6F159|nr:hypothetical protein [Massilia sp. YIM B02763]MDN4052247.1 hypothetical protein [Massilia sp. YIM B02763]